jgi:hypothetical protein
MPLQIPTLDDRRYQELLDEALARIPVHNPEWTNFNESDPGVTLIEIFAFLTENLLYRSNQIPERNRRKFLSLLGVPLQPATSARGLVTFANERGPRETITLNSDIEVRAGQVPFRTERGLDLLPVEARVYYKRALINPDPQLTDYYKLLYASYTDQPLVGENELQLYETVPLDGKTPEGVAIGEETVDGLWIALLTRAADKPAGNSASELESLREAVRQAIAGKTLNLGIVPLLDNAARDMLPVGLANPEAETLLLYQIPNVPADGLLPANPQLRVPQYKTLDARVSTDVLAYPGTVEITLAQASELRLWTNLDPLEPGVDGFPPALDETTFNDRLITWLRIRPTAAIRTRLLWVGINAVFVNQRAHIANELLPNGTGAPDQVMKVAHAPLVPHSVRLTVTTADGKMSEWQEIDDLLSAGPEVQVDDLRRPPGLRPSYNPLVEVFAVNPESGEIKFGDGFRGKRPPAGAVLRVSYDYTAGTAGNVGADAINSGPALPAGVKVSNPIRAWGGAEAEPVGEGEKQIARYLQHRDRLVSAMDFETIALRTPGVDIGRIDVIPAFNPELAPNEPGDAPGAVTLMVIPRTDPAQPDAPLPDRLFLDTICRYLDSRRLVTTEVFLRGPVYKPIWVSAGINVVAGTAIAETREAVKQALLEFLAPIGPGGILADQTAFLTSPQYADMQKGWPLRKSVTDREMLAVASRVPGVLFVNDVKIAQGTNPPVTQIPMAGLELPRVAGISVMIGEPLDLDQLRGQSALPADGSTVPGTRKMVPVPVIPEKC